MIRGLRQVAQRVEDLDRAVAFYAELLGRGPIAVFDPPGLAFFDLGGARLLLERGAPTALIYLEVDDVAATCEALVGRGVRVATAPHVVFDDTAGLFGAPGEEWLAFVEDPEGNRVGLMGRRGHR